MEKSRFLKIVIVCPTTYQVFLSPIPESLGFCCCCYASFLTCIFPLCNYFFFFRNTNHVISKTREFYSYSQMLGQLFNFAVLMSLGSFPSQCLVITMMGNIPVCYLIKMGLASCILGSYLLSVK